MKIQILVVLTLFWLEGYGVVELNEDHGVISTGRVSINSGFKNGYLVLTLHWAGIIEDFDIWH